MTSRTTLIIFQIFIGAFLFSATTVWATNGMNMIGYDAITSAMGGADAAAPGGSTALAANPANLILEFDKAFAIHASLLMPNLSMSNNTPAGSNDITGEDQIFPLPCMSYAARIGMTNFAWGLGVFAQGGMGVDFQDLNTGFGNQDDLYSNVSFLKAAPTLAYRVNDQLAFGASVHAGYAALAYEFFKNTSFYDVGADGQPMTADDILFPGQELENATSYGYAGKFGFHYSPVKNLFLGGSYNTKADLDFENGDLTMNFSAMGLGTVTYEATIEGFTWPASYELGIAYRALNEKLLLALDFTVIQWSDAIKEVTIKGTNPDNSALPEMMQEMELVFPFNWEDQTVIAFGAAYSLSDAFSIRGGVNLSESPVKDEYVSPLFPAIIENHVTLGFGYQAQNWTFDIAYERALEASQTNDNADQMENPFGPGVEVSHDQNTVHLMLSYLL